MCRHVADVHVDDHQVRVVEPSWEELVDIAAQAQSNGWATAFSTTGVDGRPLRQRRVWYSSRRVFCAGRYCSELGLHESGRGVVVDQRVEVRSIDLSQQLLRTRQQAARPR